MLNNRVARWTMAAAFAAGALMQTQSGALLAGALIEPLSQAAAQQPALPPPPAVDAAGAAARRDLRAHQ